MPDHPYDRPAEPTGELEHLARQRFLDPPLTEAELRLLRAAPKGELAVCGPNADDDDPANDPEKATNWGPERVIRADLIRWLCVSRPAKELIDPKGIQAYGARIPDALDLSQVNIPFALTFWNCRFDQKMNLRGVHVPALDLEGTWVRSIGADGTSVAGDVFLRNKFRANGEVRLLGAQIGGDLDCQNASFNNPAQKDIAATGQALNFGKAVVKGSVFLRNGFRAEGGVRLLSAQIGSNLECDNSMFNNPAQKNIAGTGEALNTDGAVVKGSVFLRNGFRAQGEVRLLGLQIGRDLDCQDASFHNPAHKDVAGTGDALSADRAVVKGGVFFRNGFRAEGEVRLSKAEIAGDLTCDSADFHGMLRAEGVSVASTLYWTNITDPSQAQLNLIDAEVDTLVDDQPSWPVIGNLWLDGFVHRRISGNAPKDAKSRLDWLSRQRSFTPQPYRHLAKVLRDEGDDSGARRVLYEMELRRRNKEDRNLFKSFWSAILRRTIGYGYYPGNALAWLVLIVLLGWPLFRGAYFSWNMTPNDKDAYLCFHQKDHSLPANYEHFCASIYSLEKTFPLVKLGQVDRWQPDPSPRPPDGVTATRLHRLGRSLISPSFLTWFGRGQTVLGWILATLFAAGVTGVVRKQ